MHKMRRIDWSGTGRLEGSFLLPPQFKATTTISVTPPISGAIFAVNHGIFSASHVNIALSIEQDIYLRVR
jgi:hypothetical protein